MFKKEEAKKIYKMIDKELVFLFRETTDHLSGYIDKQYLYTDLNVRREHIKLMTEQGYIFDEDHSLSYRLYSSFHDEEKYVTLTAVFYKKIKED